MKYVFNVLKILISVAFIFAAGILYEEKTIFSIVFLIIGVLIHVCDYLLLIKAIDGKIDGNGIGNITVSDVQTESPKKVIYGWIQNNESSARL